MDSAFDVGDVIWVKIEGHVWWPSLACGDFKLGNDAFMEVQFLGTNSRRTSVKDGFVKLFTREDCQKDGNYFCFYPDWKRAVLEAEEALGLSKEERLKKLKPSDKEDAFDIAKAKDASDIAEDKVASDITEAKDAFNVTEVEDSQLDIHEQAELFFGHQRDAHDQSTISPQERYLLRLLRSGSDGLEVYEKLVKRYEDKEPNWFLERFTPVMNGLFMDVCGYRIMLESESGMDDFCFPKFLNFFSKNKILASVFFDFERNMSNQNGSIEGTILGTLMTLGSSQYANLFKKYKPKKIALIIQKLVGKIWRGMFDFIHRSLQFCNNALVWMGDVLYSYRYRNKFWDTHKLSKEIHADLFILNLQQVLFRMFTPYIKERSTSIPGIQHTYCMDSAHNANLFLTATEVFCLIPFDPGEKPISGVNYQISSDLFFMNQACFDRGFVEMNFKYEHVLAEVNQIHERYQKLEKEGLKDTERGMELNDRLKNARFFLTFLDIALTIPMTVTNSLGFVSFTADFLVHNAMTPPDDPQPNTLCKAIFPTPGDRTGARLKYIPLFMVDNLCEYLLFLKRAKDKIFEEQSHHLQSLFDFLLLFMMNPRYNDYPHSRIRLPTVLRCLFPKLPVGGGHRQALVVQRPNANHMITCLMGFTTGMGLALNYPGINNTNLRDLQNFYEMFLYLLGKQQHRAALGVLVEQANNHGEFAVSTLLRFISIIASDASCFLIEAAKLITEIRQSSQAWETMTEGQRMALKASNSHKAEWVEHLNAMGMIKFGIMADLTCNSLSKITHPVILALIAVTADNYIPKLLVEWEKEFAFDCQTIFYQIFEIFQSMANNDTFMRILSRCIFSCANLLNAAKAQAGNDRRTIKVIEKISTRINELYKRMVLEETFAQANDMPDIEDRKDLVSHLLVRDPVRGPSNKAYDASSIITWMLENYSDPTDPYTRQPFTIDDLRPDGVLREQIEQWFADHPIA